ncbi:MAG: superoxide dismutase [Ni], partial [Gammaproteobacteria bacterium]
MKINEVLAHCDIPCKIYDPIVIQIAALTVVRIIDIIEEK